MGSIAPPALETLVQTPPRPEQDSRLKESAPVISSETPAKPIARADAAKALSVRMDAEARRFVQVLTDAASQETIWRYPSETQLAYSRAVMAYLHALSER